jgi:CO dehydrogenase/acetyl-CoA synthase beta subunit
MEQLKTNLLNLVSGEHNSVYSFAKQVLLGIESEEKTLESKIANRIFQSIIQYGQAIVFADQELQQIIITTKNEKKQLQNNNHYDLGLVSVSKYENSINQMNKYKIEIFRLADLVGLNEQEIYRLFQLICSVIEFKK